MDSRATRPNVDPRTSLALWLRAGRTQSRLSLDEVARVTKIQPRILEQLETGQVEGLPADVFVRGFVKSFARCVGLSEGEALKRWVACAGVASPTSATARAFIETLVAAPSRPRMAAGTIPPPFASGAPSERAAPGTPAELAVRTEVLVPSEGYTVTAARVASSPSVEPPNGRTKKRRGRRRKQSRKQSQLGTANPDTTAADPPSHNAVGPVVTAAPPSNPDVGARYASEAARPAGEHDADTEPAVVPPAKDAKPTRPAMSLKVPWRRPASAVVAVPVAPLLVPSLVIDDADPDFADMQRDEREAAKKPGPQRVSFLPPILLDRDERGGRQGGLTLAVILLLIAATLTLSYLMRRPTVSGDGVTSNDSDTPIVAVVLR